MAEILPRSLALIALVFAVGAFALRWRSTQRHPLSTDRSPARGSPGRGLIYAFTLGMAPWAKESTRRHWLAYLRGIVFHIGVFAGLAALLGSPLWDRVPAGLLRATAFAVAAGGLCGILGLLARRIDPNLRSLSTADDYASVAVVTAFQAATALALLNSIWLPTMYLTGALLLLVAPLGKIRHCIYFIFSRRFFGLFLGRRGLLYPERAR